MGVCVCVRARVRAGRGWGGEGAVLRLEFLVPYVLLGEIASPPVKSPSLPVTFLQDFEIVHKSDHFAFLEALQWLLSHFT